MKAGWRALLSLLMGLTWQCAASAAEPPRRIVSLLPSLTESVCALGACEALVAVDDYSNWPPQVARLPRVGGLEDANIERIVALQPDLVLLARSSRVIERLRALGLNVVVLEPDSLAQMEGALRELGRLLGREAQAAQLLRDMDAGVARVAAALPAEAKGLRVYFEVNAGPYAASESSFIGQTLARLGLANVVPGSLGPFPQINPEFVVRANPQLIMVGDRESHALAARPGWRHIEALRSGRICYFTPAEGDVLVRPGPRMVEAAEVMARCVQRTLAAPAAKKPGQGAS